MKTIINTEAAPKAIGPYSQAISFGDLIFTSGQIPVDPATGEFVPGGVAEQTRASLNNVAAILKEAGSSPEKILKTTVFLKDMATFAEMNKAYAEFFGDAKHPARSTVEVARLPKDALVEIEVIATK